MEIDKIYLEHIKSQIEQANVILFTGAGFSMSAKNKLGQTLPSGSQLAETLWSQVRPGTPLDGATLEDVFTASLKISRHKTVQTLKNILNVDSSSLPDFYKIYLNQPWHKVYTLNVDNFWHAAFLKFGPKRGFSIFSATTSRGSTSHGFAPLSIVHLNGSYDDIPDSIVFSVDQYAQRLKEFDRFYMEFVSAFATKTVLFIGTPIDESPFWKHIQIRKSKSLEDGHRELRPRSYIICPSLNEARKSILSDYNIVHIPMTAETFSTVLEQMQESTAKGINKIAKEIEFVDKTGTIKLVSDLITDEVNAASTKRSDFLIGAEPLWSDITNEIAIPRTIEKDIISKIESALKSKEKNKILLLTGTAGDGKSTLAMRIAAQLSASGKKVAWLDQYIRIRTSEIPEKIAPIEGLDVLLVDNADSLGTLLSQALSECLSKGYVKYIVVIARSSKADSVLLTEELLPFTFNEEATTRLDDAEIDQLLKVLEKYNKLGVLLEKPIDLQRKSFKDRADRQLLVALIESTSGKSFAEKIVEEYHDLDSENRFIYLILALATHFKCPLTKEDILILDRIKSASVLNSIEMFSKRGLITQKSGGGFMLRHRMISDKIVDDLNQKGFSEELFKNLGFIAGIKYAQHTSMGIKRSPYKDLLTKCVNHEILTRMLSYDAAQRVYQDLEDVLKSYFHYWLQRGCLELENGNLSNTQLYINHAKALSPTDDLVETTEAHLEFKSAWLNPTSKDAHAKVEAAIRRLDIQIANRGKYSPYPFHILGSQGLQWVKRANLTKEEKSNFLEKLRKTVEEGVRHHKNERSLNELKELIRKEYLMLAVK